MVQRRARIGVVSLGRLALGGLAVRRGCSRGCVGSQGRRGARGRSRRRSRDNARNLRDWVVQASVSSIPRLIIFYPCRGGWRLRRRGLNTCFGAFWGFIDRKSRASGRGLRMTSVNGVTQRPSSPQPEPPPQIWILGDHEGALGPGAAHLQTLPS